MSDDKDPPVHHEDHGNEKVAFPEEPVTMREVNVALKPGEAQPEAIDLLLPPSPPVFKFKHQLLNLLENLGGDLHTYGVDISTTEGLQEMAELWSGRPVGSTPHEEDDLSHEDVGSILQIPSVAVEDSLEDPSGVDVDDKDLEDEAVHVGIPVYDHFLFTITAIDAHISKLWSPIIIEAPYTTNPLVLSSGIVYLHCRSSSSPSLDSGIVFEIHKAKLCVQSPRFFAYTLSNTRKTLYEVDTDKATLQRVVDWLHYPSAIDFDDYTTFQLLSIIAVAVTIGIPTLHNAIVAILFNRHGDGIEPFKADRAVHDGVGRFIKLDGAVTRLIKYLSLSEKSEQKVVAENFFMDKAGRSKKGRSEVWNSDEHGENDVSPNAEDSKTLDPGLGTAAHSYKTEQRETARAPGDKSSYEVKEKHE